MLLNKLKHQDLQALKANLSQKITMTEIPQPESKADECGQNEKKCLQIRETGIKRSMELMVIPMF